MSDDPVTRTLLIHGGSISRRSGKTISSSNLLQQLEEYNKLTTSTGSGGNSPSGMNSNGITEEKVIKVTNALADILLDYRYLQ